MSEEINHDRRRFLGTAAIAIAATQLGGFSSAKALLRKMMLDSDPMGERQMNTNSKEQRVTRSRAAGAEQRLKELGIKLPAPPEPFGTYVEAVQTGNLLFLTGMLPTEGRARLTIPSIGIGTFQWISSLRVGG
jgi:hypothetical protein